MGGGIAASQQQKAAKKGAGAAGANLEQAYGAAKKQFEPYGSLGLSALEQLGALTGMEGYRTPADIALREHLAAKPKPGGEYSWKDKADKVTKLIDSHPARQLLGDTGAALGAGIGGLAPGLASGIFKKSDHKKRVAAAAAAEANRQAKAAYEKKLAKWEAKTAELTKQRDIELQTYDPTAQLKKTPGYQFRYDTGLGAVGSNQAARNNVLGGRSLKELEQYGQGFASNEFQNEFSRLSGLAGMGERSAAALGNISVGQGTNLANLSMQNAGANSAYYGDLNNVLQGSLGNYLAYQQRQQRPQTQSPYASSYGSNSAAETPAVGTPIPTFGTDYGE